MPLRYLGVSRASVPAARHRAALASRSRRRAVGPMVGALAGPPAPLTTAAPVTLPAAESCAKLTVSPCEAPVTDREALLAAALDHPADDTVRLVLADSLDENGEGAAANFKFFIIFIF